MRLIVLALVLGACKPSVTPLERGTTQSLTESANDLAQAQREAQSARSRCQAWNLRAFSVEERATLSDELLHRWLSAPIAVDGGVVVGPERATAPDERVTKLGQALSRNLQGHTFSFLVVTDSALDTFSVPDGRVLITRGLLEACTTDAQLAGVLAHEVAHVFYEHALSVARHEARTRCEVEVTTKALMRATRASMGMQAEFTELMPDLEKTSDQLAKRMAADLAEQLALRGYGTKEQAGPAQELQADRSAAEWMHGAGHDIREYEAVLGKFEALSLPHPRTSERIAALEERRLALPPLPPPPKKKQKKK